MDNSCFRVPALLKRYPSRMISTPARLFPLRFAYEKPFD